MTAWDPLQICRKYFVLTSETIPLFLIYIFFTSYVPPPPLPRCCMEPMYVMKIINIPPEFLPFYQGAISSLIKKKFDKRKKNILYNDF